MYVLVSGYSVLGKTKELCFSETGSYLHRTRKYEVEL